MSRSPENSDRSRDRSPAPVARDSPKPALKDAIVFDWKSKLLDLIEDNRLSRSDLADSTWDELEDMSQAMASNVVQRLSESNLERVRNFNSFTLSIMKRIKQEGPDLARGDIKNLPPQVEDAVRDLIDDGKVYVEDFDQRIVSALSTMSVDLALQAVQKFGASNLEGIRSKTGFMMAIVRKLLDDTEGRSSSYSRGGGGGGSRYTSDYSSDRYRSDRYGQDRYGSDRYGSDRYNSDRYGSDRYGSDRYGADRYGEDRYGSDRHRPYDDRRYDDRGYDDRRYESRRYGDRDRDYDRYRR